MRLKHFPQIKARRGDPRGYTRWFCTKRFLAECCDCGLVHEFQFKVIDGKPAFRLRRANGYTKRQRNLRNDPR